MTTLFLAFAAMPVGAELAPESLHHPRLVADRSAYVPDAIVRLTGVGFDPGSIVTLRVVHADGTPTNGSIPAHRPWTVDVDANGWFKTTWSVCSEDCLHTLLSVEATGSGALAASTTFMDDPEARKGASHRVSGLNVCQRHVLLLSDIDNVGTSALADALTSAGHIVTVRPAPEFTWDTTNPPLTGFDCVVHLDGATYNSPLSVPAQLALQEFVHGGGTFVGSQWNGYERSIGQQLQMDDIILQLWDSTDNCGGCDMSWTTVLGQESHPVLEGVPPFFTFRADGHDAAPEIVYVDQPTTVLMRSPSGGPSVLAREFGTGHVVNFSSAANYNGDQTLQDPNIQRLYVNAVNWGQCSNQSPDCGGAVALTESVWPPNHEYTAVTIVGVTDPDGDPVSIVPTGIAQDEPLDSFGDGNTCPDGKIEEGVAYVRQERSGHGNGRVYHVSFEATDARGAVCQGEVTVCVPHDQDLGSACVDDGGLYNSLGPCRDALGKGDPLVLTITELVVRTMDRQAVVEYSLASDADVNLSVFDLAGRRVATIENAHKVAGNYTMTWDASGLTRGMYFYRLRAGDAVVTRSAVHTE